MIARLAFSTLISALFISALALVLVRHQNRQAFLELQQLQTQRDELIIQWGRLQLEYSTLAHPARIEKLARRRLNMSRPANNTLINLGNP